MTQKELTELAEMVAPHLAWNLTKTDLYYFSPANTRFGETQSGRLQQADLLISKIFQLIENNDNFVVAVIPKNG